MKFGVFIYEGVEPVDLATYGVLSMAKRIKPEIEICTIAPKRGNVLFSNGLVVQADFGIEDAPEVDVLIVTGGPGWVEQAKNQTTLLYLKHAAVTSLIASVCTGAMILAASGVLDGKTATTKRAVVEPEYPPINLMQKNYDSIKVVEGSVIDNGRVITGGGVTLCIDTTLYILEKIFDAETAAETARIMEYTVARSANMSALPFQHSRHSE
ncbi:transcriptional regulator, AraC family [Janthinobacterium sp. Marseille]|uniref:DJ-1/PfpI family protein n=1 Tax=Herminiimonas aquatilis TaxID=345342 RepID=A0ABW2J652_9BURK|nr:DJ-1/PfpI family protein [Janthinobacterium sp. Marseille]ABR91821.1 transcriptional regulator, AraC family [Janthinobacterium sp. Marseille]